MNDTGLALMGDNLPPATDVDALLMRLREDHRGMIARRDELIAGLEAAPEEIEDGDEETAGKLADLIQKQTNEFLKRAGTVHEDEKAPFLAAGRTVDSFKHTLVDELERLKIKVNVARKAYADRKKAAEEARREEAARIAREAAAEARRKADEEAAERRRIEAEAQRKADEEAAARRAEAAEAQRKATEAAKELADEEAFKKAEAAQKVADKVQRQSETAARLAQKEADRVARANAAARKVTDKEADRAERAAIKADRATGAKAAELGKSRGEHGGQTSLKEYPEYTALDRATLDLEALRYHLADEAIDKALRSYMAANKDGVKDGTAQIEGVRMYMDTRL